MWERLVVNWFLQNEPNGLGKLQKSLCAVNPHEGSGFGGVSSPFGHVCS